MRELENDILLTEHEETDGESLMLISPKERMKREHQIKVLEEDRDRQTWEKSHLVLYIVAATPGTRWEKTMWRAYKAYDRGDLMRFDLILGELKEMCR